MIATETKRHINVQNFTYQAALAASEKINWRVEDLIGPDRQLDFNLSFMPEKLARVEPLAFLSPAERRALNQIRGNAYLCIFGLVEEFILPFVVDHVRLDLGSDDYRTRAFLVFAGEEAKHIQLFKHFRTEFEQGFGTQCNVIGPPAAIAKAVLAHPPLAVALVILQIEWMTQAHFVESIKDSRELDLQFKSLLRYHWFEESQHAKLDTLMLETIAQSSSDADIKEGIQGYAAIGELIDGGLQQQVEFDLDSFERATGRKLDENERKQFIDVQLQANRWTYLGSGMSHPNFLTSIDRLQPGAADSIRQMIPMFS